MDFVSEDALRAAVISQGIGVAELARLAKLSRTTVTKALGGSGSRVHTRTREKLAEALGLSAAALEKDHVEVEYRRCVTERYRYLERRGLGIVNTNRQVPIEHGFVPFMLRQQESADDCRRRYASESSRSNGSGDPVQRPQQKPESLQLPAAIQRSRRLFVLGEPGSGKTTMLSHLAWQMASNSADVSRDRRMPVFVRLSVWAELLSHDDEVSAFHAAVNDILVSEVRDTIECLEQHASRGDVIFLLDGLDEVADPEDRAVILSKIRETVCLYPQAHILITSRPVGFDSPNLGVHFDAYRVERFDRESIGQFIERWCYLRHGHSSRRKCSDCQESSDGMRRAVFDNDKLLSLSGNPMMLTILCLLYESGAALPQRRVQLYERIIEAFLFTWEQEKRAAVSGTADRNLALDDRDALWLLESIALDMQKHDWTLVPRWWLSSKSAAFLQEELGYEHDQARATSEVLLRSLEHRTGVLTERGQDKYGFQHLAFQEYFAARAILGESDPIEAIRPYIYHPRWREVVRLVASSLDRRRAPQLLRVILDDPDPAGRFLQRGLLLALECLVDGAPVHHGNLLVHMEEGVVQLGVNKWIGLALEAIASLQDLRGTRLEGMSRRSIDGLLTCAKENLDRSAYVDLFMHVALCRFRESRNSEDDGSEVVESPKQPVREVDGPDGHTMAVAAMPSSYDERWADSVLMQLECDSSANIRLAAAGVLGRFARSQANVRDGFVRALGDDKEASVRESVAYSLRFAARDTSVRTALLQRMLDREEDAEVRASCASALRGVAVETQEIRRALIELLDAAEEAGLRAGVVHGLSRCFADDQDLERKVFAMLVDSELDESIRVSCLHALEQRLPSIDRGVKALAGFLGLGSGDLLCRASAQTLAEYAATGRVSWESLPIEQIEQVLVSINTPSEHALSALRSLVDAREVRRFSFSREARIERALRGCREGITSMFVFGSSARDEQDPDSDIDLMVIGEISLRDLTPALRRAEAELGRQVNVVMYTQSEWQQKIAERNPFVMRVWKAEKRFVMGHADDLGTMVEQ